MKDLPLDWARCHPMFRDCPVKNECLRYTSRPETVKPLSYSDFTVHGVDENGDCVEMIKTCDLDGK